MDITHAPVTGLEAAFPPGSNDDITDATTRDGVPGDPAATISVQGSSAQASLATLSQSAAPHLGTHALALAALPFLPQSGVAEFRAALPGGGGASGAQSPGFGPSLLRLPQEPGVQALRDPALQDRLLAICSSDRAFADGLAHLLASPAYTALGANDRAAVLRDVIRLHDTRSYREAEGGNRQQAMVEIVGDIAAQSAARPGNAAVRNTLDHVLDGDVTLRLYYADVGPNKLYDFGWAKPGSDIISMNIDPRTRRVAERDNEYLDTLVHETNHFVNGTTPSGTPERFLDELRATVVGVEATQGHPVSPAQQKAILDNLVDGSNAGYKKLHDLYTHDKAFKAVVDSMYATLAGGPDGQGHELPGLRVSLEDARQRLLKLDPDNDYLSTRGNLDNR